MSANVAVLSHNQEVPTSLLQRGITFIPKDVANEMVRQMAAERISAKLIRLMPPGSIFPQLNPKQGNYVPTNADYGILHGGEVPGLKFEEPTSAVPSRITRQWAALLTRRFMADSSKRVM